MSDAALPFKGLRVLSSGVGIAPLVALRLLAEQGAHCSLAAHPDFLRTWHSDIAEFCPGIEIRGIDHTQDKDRALLHQLYRQSQVLLLEQGVCESSGLHTAIPAAQHHPGCVRCIISVLPDSNTLFPLSKIEPMTADRTCLYEPLAGIGKKRPFSFPVVSVTTGMHAVVAIAAALAAPGSSVSPIDISVAMYDAALSLHALRLLMISEVRSRWDALRWLSSPFMGLWQTGDGRWIYLHVGLAKHLALFLKVIEHAGHASEAAALCATLTPPAMNDPICLDSPRQAHNIRTVMRGLFLKQSAKQWESLLQRYKLCCTMVRSEPEWRAWSADPAFIGKNTARTPLVRLACSMHAARKPGPEGHGKEGLSSAAVFDFTQVIAGPLAGRTLAELGATVVRIRNPHFDQAFTEPFAASFHSGKENITCDLSKEADKRALDTLIRERKPRIILRHTEPPNGETPDVAVRILAYPEQSSWAQVLGFEQNIQAMAGLMTAYGSASKPELFPIAVYDTVTGLLAAFGACAGLYAHARYNTPISVRCSLMDSAHLLADCTRLHHAYSGSCGAEYGKGFGFFALRRQLKHELKRAGSSIRMLRVPGLGPVPVPVSPAKVHGQACSLLATPLPDTTMPRKKPSFLSRLAWMNHFFRHANKR